MVELVDLTDLVDYDLFRGQAVIDRKSDPNVSRVRQRVGLDEWVESPAR